jgi:hypothetical protein
MPRTITIPMSFGSDPELIEIDDTCEAVGVEPEMDEFSYPIEFCDLNPCGYCEYSMADQFTE